jgi:hypothetical protein
MRTYLRLASVPFVFLSVSALHGQTIVVSPQVTLQSVPQHDARTALHTDAHAPATEVFADLRAHLEKADPKQRGEVWLDVSAASDQTRARLTLRVPLANTGDVYGESRSCSIAPDGREELTFTAGMDEKNFMGFSPAGKDIGFHLLLNKYLCRALAAPFHCAGRTVTLPSAWSSWQFAESASLTLSADAPAKLDLSRSATLSSGASFDPAQCAVVAPSNGMCCVAHKTTEWHCGGTPAGDGWHQVSGECFHRETGGSCSQ